MPLMADTGAMDDALRHRIEALALEPHPEGGYYRRIHASRIEVEANGHRRPAMTAIRYLLGSDGRSAWHRIDADECWHWDDGGVLELLRHAPGSSVVERVLLGPASAGGTAQSCIVPAGAWQSARALQGHVLVTCVVAPGFVWEGFELLDPGDALARELAGLAVVQR